MCGGSNVVGLGRAGLWPLGWSYQAADSALQIKHSRRRLQMLLRVLPLLIEFLLE